MSLVHRFIVRVHPKEGADFETVVYADRERDAMLFVRNMLEARNGLEEFEIVEVRHTSWADPATGELS